MEISFRFYLQKVSSFKIICKMPNFNNIMNSKSFRIVCVGSLTKPIKGVWGKRWLLGDRNQFFDSRRKSIMGHYARKCLANSQLCFCFLGRLVLVLCRMYMAPMKKCWIHTWPKNCGLSSSQKKLSIN